MQEFFSGKVKEFYGGTVVGFITGWHFLFAGPLGWGDLVIQYVLKFLATIIFAFVSGIMTVLAKDFYVSVIKPRLFKKK